MVKWGKMCNFSPRKNDAMAEQRRLYPIGQQDFPSLRRKGSIYIDKTEYVYNMTHSQSEYMFLSRPRRFGKSLLISTLQAYFEGRRELFKGLAIEKSETEWEQYPVLCFDMSTAKHQGEKELEQELSLKLTRYEQYYGTGADEVKLNSRFEGLIKRAYEKTGKGVVVLIDEYDAPLLDVAHEEENLPRLRQIMRNFYSPLKACAPYLRYVFLTGITKFSQLSIFSELNNIENISMDEKYAAICGITKEELRTQMSVDIDLLAENLKISRDATIARLIDNYDGYHFTWPSPDVFNPFSLLMAMAKGKIDSYWFGSGTPTYLIEMLRRFGTLPSEIGGVEAPSSAFDAPTETMTSIVPLLYQSGYITIKGYDEETEFYTLDIPNKEIRKGLMDSLLPAYVQCSLLDGRTTIGKMYRAINKRDMDGALKVLQAFLLTIPYTDNTAYEGHYQQVLYIIFSLMNYYCDVEVRTARGRVDLVMRSKTDLYLIETKLGIGADVAMKQIDLKDYPARFADCGLPITKVAITFNCQTRTLSEWIIASREAKKSDK